MDSATLVLAATLAAVFAWSGVGKLTALGDARAMLRALRLPPILPRTAVAAMSVLELGLAAALVAAPGWALVAAAGAALALLAGFVVVTARAAARGSTDDCGCFGRSVAMRIGPALVARNVALAVAAALLTGAAAAGAAGPAAVASGSGAGRSALGMLLDAPAEGAWALAAAAAVGAVAWTIAALARSGTPREDGAPRDPDGMLGAAPVAGDAAAHDPALIDPADEVIDPFQRALLGRAQLLVFVRPGCSSCTAAVGELASRAEELGESVDAGVVVSAGAGVRVPDARALLSAPPEVPVFVDVRGSLARLLQVPAKRPVAVLIGTRGEPVTPYAHGLDELRQLADVIAASAREAARS